MLERIKALREEKEDMRMQVEQLSSQPHVLDNVAAQSAEVALLPSKSSTIQSLREQHGQALDRDGPSSFPPRARLTFTNMSHIPSELDGTMLALIKESVYIHSKYEDCRTVLRYNTNKSEWIILSRPPTAYSTICSLFWKPLLVGGKLHKVVTADLRPYHQCQQHVHQQQLLAGHHHQH